MVTRDGQKRTHRFWCLASTVCWVVVLRRSCMRQIRGNESMSRCCVILLVTAIPTGICFQLYQKRTTPTRTALFLKSSWRPLLMSSLISRKLEFPMMVPSTMSTVLGWLVTGHGWWRSGSLQRSFWNVAKHPGQANRVEGKGICHLCMAGRRAFPYEELGTRRPAWLASVLTQPPFDEASHPFNFHVVPHVAGQLPTLWKFDIFHTVHLGIGKNYLGSMLALLSQQEAGGNVDLRFELLSAKYRSWCSSNHRPTHCKRITKEHVNWVSTTCYPTGSWHKGDLTTSLLLFCEAMYQSEAWEDETLRLAGQAAEALNRFLRLLYHAEAWLSKDEGFEAAQLGLRFLRRYSHLAKLAYSQGQKLWLVMPKAHSFHHICLELLEQSKVGVCTNPLCFSVQQDEDFIGRGARLSRHVSSVHCSERTVDRYLMASYSKFIESGYLVVAKGWW